MNKEVPMKEEDLTSKQKLDYYAAMLQKKDQEIEESTEASTEEGKNEKKFAPSFEGWEELAKHMGAEEIGKLKKRIAELNKDFQGNKVMDKYGKDHGFNKDETYAWMEQQVKEAEDKIRELEGGGKKAEQREKDKKNAEKEAAIDDAIQFLRDNGEDGAADKLQGALDKNLEGLSELAEITDPREMIDQRIQPGPGGGEEMTGEKPKPVEVGEEEEEPVIPPVPPVIPPVPPVIPPIPPVIPPIPKPVPEIPTQRVPEVFKKPYETEKKKGGVWGWIKERLKGFATMGFWEFHQAERFRSQTKKESKGLAEEAKSIQQLENLDYETAYAEAAKIREMAEAGGERSRDDYEKFSRIITQEKMDANTKEIERIMRESTLSLEERLKKYKNESGGSVINAVNMEAYQAGLREELLKLQRGFYRAPGEAGEIEERPIAIDDKLLKKIIRENLDPKYWHRYVYGGIEMATDAALLYWGAGALAAKYGGAEITKAGVPAVIKEKIAETIYTMKKGDTLWAIAKANLMQAGVANPTPAQIMAGAKTLATANHVGVNIWGLAGSPLDKVMPVGFKVSMGALKAALPKIMAMGAAA